MLLCLFCICNGTATDCNRDWFPSLTCRHLTASFCCHRSLSTLWNHRLSRRGGGQHLQITRATPCSSRVNHSRLPGIVSHRALTDSKDGDFTALLGNCCRCSTALTVKGFSYAQMEFQAFQFVLMGLVLLFSGTQIKEEQVGGKNPLLEITRSVHTFKIKCK